MSTPNPLPFSFHIGVTADCGSTLEGGAKLIAAFAAMNSDLVKYILNVTVGGAVTITAIYCGTKYLFPAFMQSRSNEVRTERLENDMEKMKERMLDVEVDVDQLKGSFHELENMILKEIVEIRNKQDGQFRTNKEVKQDLLKLKNQVSAWTQAPETDRIKLISQIQEYLDHLNTLEAEAEAEAEINPNQVPKED